MDKIITWGLTADESLLCSQQENLAGVQLLALQAAQLGCRLEEIADHKRRSLTEIKADPDVKRVFNRVPDQEIEKITAMMTAPSTSAEDLLPQLSDWKYFLLLMPKESIQTTITLLRAVIPCTKVIFSAVTPLAKSWFIGDYLLELQQEHLLMQQWRRQARQQPSPQ